MTARPVLTCLFALLFATLSACDTGPDQAGNTTSSIIRGNGGEPGSLDPQIASDIHAFNILLDLYEGLVTESASGSLVPGTAGSWDIRDDGLTYVFRLRPEARWADGTRVVAADFVRAFRRAADPDTASAYAFLLEPIAGFSAALAGEAQVDEIGVQATDEETLVISLERPATHLLSILSMPVAFPNHPTDERLGNGAYKLAERIAGGAVRLVRNEHYRDAENVGIDEVTYLPVVDLDTELNMFRSGELDITNSVPPEFIAEASRHYADNLRIAPMLALYYLAFDMSAPPFDDIELRKALSMAVDREQLASLIGRGEVPAYSVVPPGTADYDGADYAWKDLSRPDREAAARSAYAAAGFSRDQPLRIDFVYDTGDIHERVALAVAAMWRDVLGVETTLDKREWMYFLDTRDQREEWDAMRFAWFGDYNSPMTFLEIFESSSPQNLPGYRSLAYDATVATAVATTDRRAAGALMAEAESTLLENYPVAPLYFFVSKHLVDSRIAGFEDNIMDRHPSRYLRIRPAGSTR